MRRWRWLGQTTRWRRRGDHPLSGSSVLRRSLISENVSYPAGTPGRPDVQLAWYRSTIITSSASSTGKARRSLASRNHLALFGFD
jgi:hypothetical protein